MHEKIQNGKGTKRFLLADDSEVVRGFLREIIIGTNGWSVCAEAGDGLAAVELAESLHPDCVILDFAMPRLNGIEAARLIARRSPNTAILLISMHEEAVLGRHLTAEIKGFVPKSRVAWELLPAIQAVLAGGKYFVSSGDGAGGVQPAL
jgi:DNA-binding NarL/FixJ family response regulator